MTDTYVQVETKDGVATLTVNKPPLNVVDMVALRQLESALAELAKDESVLIGGPSDRRFSRWYDSDTTNWLLGRYKTLRP